MSSNIVDANGKTPAEWKPSHTFKFPGGVKVAIVGFSNDDIPSLTKPGSLDPFHVANSLTSVNAEAAKVNKKADAVVAIGHLGATEGTLTAPIGPLMDLANGVSNVDVVIGDHTDQQALTKTAGGVLVTENRSKGLRFTRVRIVIGDGKDGVVYKTADFHKPWDIGVTPDPAIQAVITDLIAQLAPIFNTLVGKSTVGHPACRCMHGGDRTHRRPGLRIAHRRPRHRCHPIRIRDRLRAHQLGRPPRRPDLPDRRRRSELGRLLPAGRVPGARRRACIRSPGARSSACSRSGTCRRP